MTLNNRFHATIFALVCVLASACSGSVGDISKKNAPPTAGEPVTSTGVVKVNAEALTLDKGKSGTAVVRLEIQKGYHVNANPPSLKYLIPTELQITPAGGVSVGFITYPDALTKTFSFSPDAPLKVYEGEALVKAMLKADAAAETGQHNLSAKLRVQACDDNVCYPPGMIDLVLPVTVK